MAFHVDIENGFVPIDRAVFEGLLENSVVSGRVPYQRALSTGQIPYSELVELSRRADIPHSLFFAPISQVEAQLDAKNSKLLQGISKKTFSVNSRERVELSDIELIVKDLLRKQQMLKASDPSLGKNPIVGLLRRSGSVETEAAKLLSALGLNHRSIRETDNKTSALDLLIGALERRQVLVSQSVNNFMPQLLRGVKFSAMTIRDRKVPYVFLNGGDHGDFQEPVGRRIFTLTLLTVLLARGIFAPVTYDGHSTESGTNREFEVAGEILMPVADLMERDLGSLDLIKQSADEFKVTPSALVVRMSQVGMIERGHATSFLEELAVEFSNRKKSKPRQPKPANGIRKYNGREFCVRMFDALDSQKISRGNFCRTVCLNRIRPSQLEDFREALG